MNADQQAFPTPPVLHPADGGVWAASEPGLTKLEYFAGQALQGVLANEKMMATVNQFSPGFEAVSKRVAEAAAEYASALIAELDRRKAGVQ